MVSGNLTSVSEVQFIKMFPASVLRWLFLNSTLVRLTQLVS